MEGLGFLDALNSAPVPGIKIKKKKKVLSPTAAKVWALSSRRHEVGGGAPRRGLRGEDKRSLPRCRRGWWGSIRDTASLLVTIGGRCLGRWTDCLALALAFLSAH